MKRLNKGKKFSRWTAVVHSSPVAGLSRQRSLFIQNEGWRIPQYTHPPSQSNTMMISGGEVKDGEDRNWSTHGWYWEEQCCVVDFCPSWKFFVALNQTITNLVSCFQSQWHQSGDSVGNEAFGVTTSENCEVQWGQIFFCRDRSFLFDTPDKLLCPNPNPIWIATKH